MRFVMRFRDRLLGATGCLALLFASVSHAAELEVVNEGGIGHAWAAAPGSRFAAPGYPAAMRERRAHVCLNLAYTLNEDGIPSDLMLLKYWSRDDGNVPLSEGELDGFIQSSAMALTQWRFVPKEGVKRVKPTRTSATLVFRGNNELSNADIAANCRIGDLVTYMETQDGEAARQRTVRQILQRTEFQQQAERMEGARQEALRRVNPPQ
ncbi:MAG TPA: hypothetical protein VN581_08735 [Patescibacteria group bacterium]|nr:hypothetical protein [Patescibacteria group bacterium]